MPANVRNMFSGEELTPWWVKSAKDKRCAILDGLRTAMEARELAMLTWEPELVMVHSERGAIPDYRAIYRGNGPEFLGMVSDRYHPILNATLAEVADAVCGNIPSCTTAGELMSGGIVWFAMKLGEFKVSKDKSPVVLYLVITTGHDGRHRAQVLITPVRVVCQNTLRAAFLSAKYESSIIHNGDATARLKAAAEAGIKAVAFMGKFNVLADVLAETIYRDAMMRTMSQVVTLSADEKAWITERQRAGEAQWNADPSRPLVEQLLEAAPFVPDHLIPDSAKRERAIMAELLHTGEGFSADMEQSAWGAFQAITQFEDHERKYRTTKNGSADDRRAESILFGDAADRKSVALECILAQTGLTSRATAIMN